MNSEAAPASNPSSLSKIYSQLIGLKETAIQYVLDNEGGFTIDDGGPTMYGIVKSDVARFDGVPVDHVTTSEMRELTKAKATLIYISQYWNEMRLDEIRDINVACCIFDTGVNRGLSVGVKYAQKVCNQLGAALKVDGELGDHTIAQINALSRTAFIKAYEALEFAGYEALLAANPAKYGAYRHGWESRARRLLTLAA